MLGLPVSIWILIVLALLAATYVAHSTPISGSSSRSAAMVPARMSGIRVDVVKIFVYMFISLCGDRRPHHLVAADGLASGHR